MIFGSALDFFCSGVILFFDIAEGQIKSRQVKR